jgi:hypothetical protein
LTPLEWLTAALVVINGVFALQMVRSVAEMKRSRELQVMPKLTPQLRPLGPAFAFLTLGNVGQGPALDVQIEVIFEGRGDVESEHRRWRTDLFAPGESHDFLTPKTADLDELTSKYRRVAVKGGMKDSLGHPHKVDEASDDLEEMWQTLKASGQVMDQDYVKKIADAAKKLADAAERISRKLP